VKEAARPGFTGLRGAVPRRPPQPAADYYLAWFAAQQKDAATAQDWLRQAA